MGSSELIRMRLKGNRVAGLGQDTIDHCNDLVFTLSDKGEPLKVEE